MNDDTKEAELFLQLKQMEQAQKSLSTITANELLDTSFPARSELVAGFLPQGTYLLAGAPKVGKSFFVTQLCGCVATGQPFLGMDTRPSTVLYLSLEDTQARMQERLVKMFHGEDLGGLHLGFRIRSPAGLLDDLERFHSEHPDIQLVVIDTLQCVRQDSGGKGSYGDDYKAVERFKTFADRHHIVLIIVHHTRKDQSDENPFNMILGTNGLLGAADGAYILYRSKPEADAILTYTGRDLPQGQFTLRFDRETCLWQMIHRDTVYQPAPDPLIDAIGQMVTKIWEGTATQLAELLRTRDPPLEFAPNALTRKLNVLASRLEAEMGIRYTMRRTMDSRILTFQKLKHDGNDDSPDTV